MREASPHRVIRASAGAGKTFRLSNRYLQLLRAGAQPDEILATTFTRKAAGEILGRVLQRLAHAAVDEEGAARLAVELDDPKLDLPEVRGLLAVVCEQIHRVAVSTIDSFFHRMVGCFRYELGLPRELRLMHETHPVVAALRREAIDAMLGDDAPEVLVSLMRRLHHDQAQRRITDAIDSIVSDLYHAYRQTDAAAWHRVPTPDALERDQVIDAVEALRACEAALPTKPYITAWKNNLAAAEVGDWEGFLENGLAAKIAAGEETFSSRPIPERIREAYRPLVMHARAMIVRRLVDQTEATHALLRRFDTHYVRLRREHRVLLFSDLPLLLCGAVAMGEGARDLEPLYYRLDGRVQHLLLDEFQDTSPIQWRVLRPFAEEIRAGEGGELRPGAPARSFFCVGDVKQAIYGWRDGCAEIFDEVMSGLNLGPEAEERLSLSYRSSQIVLDAVNRVFEGIVDAPPLADVREHVERWRRGFETHKAHKDLPGYVRVEASPAADGADAAVTHAEFVAERIASLAAAHPARTIGVLVRTNGTASDLLHRLRELGVAASGEGGSYLTTEPAVELILSALTLADHPGHTAAAHHVKHSPLAEAVGLRTLSKADIAEASRSIRRVLAHGGYAAVITAWARVLAAVSNRRGVERLEQLIDLAEQYDATPTLRSRDFVRFVESHAVEDPSPARVRVMTVHKAKGLEFDVVVLPELNDLIGQAARLAVWQLRPEPVASASLVVRSVSQRLLPIVAEHCEEVAEAREQEVGRRVADDLSALYVAMTRPRHALHVVLEPVARTKGGWSSVGRTNCSFASVLRYALGDGDEPREGVIFEVGDPGWDRAAKPQARDERVEKARTPKVSLSKGGRRRSWSVVTPSRLAEGGRVDAAELMRIEGDGARERGSRIHEALAEVDWLGAGEEAPQELREMLAQPVIRAVFTKPSGAVTLWRERPFVVRVGGELVVGRFDRVVLFEDHAELVDFKTDRLYPGESIQTLVDHYRPQLEAYRRALGQMLRLDPAAVRARLVFTSVPAVVEV